METRDIALIKALSNGAGGASYTLPIASSTQLGGVQPAAKTETMTQAVGVDAGGALWTEPGGGGGSGGEHLVLLNSITMEEDGTFSITQDFDGNPISEKHVIVVAKIPAYSGNKDSHLVVIGSGGTYATISWGLKVFTTKAFYVHELIVVGGELLDRFVVFSEGPSSSADGAYKSRYLDFAGDICEIKQAYNFVPAGTEIYVYAVR